MLLRPFERKVQRACTQPQLLPVAGVVVVACSGGADSLALLLALHALCGRAGSAFPAVHLHAAHLDHGLRGAASAADAAFVAEQCAQLGLPLTVGVVSDEEHATWQGSIEAAARTARYRFLRAVAAEVGANCIAMGHTLDDQAETVLLHLLRGSGLDGLGGMRPRADDIIRPLLRLRRADNEAYCAERGITPRNDPSNDDPRFTRNRIRHEVLPLLATLQPEIRPTLARSAEVLAHDADYLNAAADAAWPTILRASADAAITLDRSALGALHPAIRSRVLRHAILAVGSPKPDPSLNADSLARLERVVLSPSGERREVQLSTGAVAICHRDTVAITNPAHP
jgi:tRNA(Ile)-lysidine synthase